MTLQEADLAWLAGLLEGEGSFMTINSRVGGKAYRYPKIVVAMTDRDVIARAASLMGGNRVYAMPERSNRLRAFRAQISGAAAAELMTALLPLMGQRRSSKIREVLDEYGELRPASERRSEACRVAALRRYGHDV